MLQNNPLQKKTKLTIISGRATELDSVPKEAKLSIITGNSYDQSPNLDEVINILPNISKIVVNNYIISISNLAYGGTNNYIINNISGDSKIITAVKKILISVQSNMIDSLEKNINIYGAEIKSQVWQQALRDVKIDYPNYTPNDVTFDLGLLVKITAINGNRHPETDYTNISCYKIPIHVTVRFK